MGRRYIKMNFRFYPYLNGKGIHEDLDGTFLRKMPHEMKLRYNPFLDGYEEHGFHDGENHDGTERTTSSK